MITENDRKLMLCTPSDRLTEDFRLLEGDLLVLGAGGKMGPTLCTLAANAARAAGRRMRVYAVSRFGDENARTELEMDGVETISCDLMEKGALDTLPDAKNVIFMAGRKFGTEGQEAYTWAMNAWLPAHAAERYRDARIVVFSSGNIYPLMDAESGGANECVRPDPIGEYPQSVLARERMFEYAALAYGTRVCAFRLSYAIDLRYGVLCDIAEKVRAGKPVSVDNAYFNCIWQGDANEYALRALLLASSPAMPLNVTGVETAETRLVAEKFAELFGTSAVFIGEMRKDAYLSDSRRMVSLLGAPRVGLDEMIAMQADWILSGGKRIGKPTHFEERGGKY